MFGLLATLVLAATTVFHAQALPPDCDRNATVVLGQTCDDISAKYNASTYQLAQANPGINCNALYNGQVLCLGIKGHDCNTTYVVQPGDSCWKITNQYNLVPRNMLYVNNPNINPNTSIIYPKEVLCVSNKTWV